MLAAGQAGRATCSAAFLYEQSYIRKLRVRGFLAAAEKF